MLRNILLFSCVFISNMTFANANDTFSQQEEKPFVIGTLLGQLGNQFFQVAAASALAWDNGAEPYFPDFLPIRHYSHNYHHIFFRCNAAKPNREVEFTWGGPTFGYVPIPYKPNMRIKGYIQNEKYFAHHRERLLKLFQPLPSDLEYVQKKYGTILNHPNAVSVHLRCYHPEKPDEGCFIQYEKDYFEKAMALFPDTSLFIVTSDNINYARKNIFGENVVFIENEPYYIDFLIQRLCKHNIICNSTFSWWSAWLNENPDKIVVRPETWLGGYPDIGGPDEWIKVKAKSMQTKENQK